jgi:hypothetical protein
VPPSHVDVGFHIVSHDNEFRRKAVVIGAKAHDVDLSHSGRKNSEKPRGEHSFAKNLLMTHKYESFIYLELSE